MHYGDILDCAWNIDLNHLCTLCIYKQHNDHVCVCLIKGRERQNFHEYMTQFETIRSRSSGEIHEIHYSQQSDS